MGVVVLRGRVVTGQGEGARFTQLPWVRAQFVDRLGIDPHPGTLNLWLDEPAELEKWRRLKRSAGVTIEPASPEFCEARAFPVLEMRSSGVRNPGDDPPAAIILPDVPDYPEAQVELIAPVSLRETLALQDGDLLTLYISWSGELS